MARTDRRGRSLLGPPSALVARAVGVACIAVGFVFGIEGLADPQSSWLHSALALIVTGLLAQLFAMYASVRHRRRHEGQDGGGTPGPGPGEGPR